ncbi:hypothetical protein [Luteimonas sp. FCS-9]|uniref:hypothetical protein n=1 Tax=Luteimonas sp. FCS-9 TaxID=1547516 RepID=UPI00063ECB4D|nr:hypothetical protein [Luteimonas sp. FCS-9]KLJ02841.1 hypothetical protein WQ56_00735 [Luteimonas sp. FCS-9]
MSTEATKWAFQQQVGDPGRKLVLLAMAQLVDKENCCFPGLGYLATLTEQSAGKVSADLDALVALNLIGDSARRKGRRQNTVVWQLAVNGPVQHYRSPV